MFHGNDARSPGHAGDLVLVSPFKMVTNLIGGTTAGFAILELQFAPEPRSVAWLGTALALVAWVARLRKRRERQAASSPNCSS